MNPLMHILGACSVSENKLTIVMWLCCSRKDKGQAVGDLSPLELLWAVSHSNGMGLGEMLYGSVHMAVVLFDGGHVSVDRTRLLWLTTVLQPLQRLLTLA